MSTSGVGRIERLVAIGAVIAAGATLPLWAGSAEEVGSDYVVSAESGESDYLVTAPINGYARVVKKGTGTVILRTTTTEYAGDVVIEEGALYIETAGSNELRLTGNLTGGTTGTSGIFFRKRGTGTLHLDGNVDLARSVQLDQGLMEMGSAASRVFRDGFIIKGDSRSLMGGGSTLIKWIRAGNDGRGVFHQTGGILGVTADTSVGMNAADIGHWAMSGGEAYVSNSFNIAYTAGSFGSFIQTGGLFKLDGGTLSAGRGGSAVFHVAGGTNDTRVTQGGQSVRFYLGDYGGTSDVTVSGEGTLLATEKLRFAGGGTISTNIFNVKDGATVKAARFFKHQSANAATRIIVNADGGTLMPTFGYDWTDAGLSDAKYCPDHFVVWKKGLVIDTSESTGTKPASQMPFTFAPPTGKGVASITLPTSGDYTTASYIGPARIVFEDESGWGASAYAEYDFATKSHTGVVITSRGCDFSDNAKAYVESPDRTTRWECALTLSDNAGLCGEVVKRGQHDLHLYAANTTTGGVAVESGTLYAESIGVVPSGTPLRAEYGATMEFKVASPLTLSTFSGAGSVTGCDITVTDAVRATCEDVFENKFATFAGSLTFAEGAAFEISDPENLRQYMRSGFKTAFQAQQVLGSPVLRLAGSESCGNWALIRKPDGTYKFGAHAGMIIVIK